MKIVISQEKRGSINTALRIDDYYEIHSDTLV